MSLEPGQQLLHYRITEKIGEGGMGVVWKATDTTLNREVAIKVLPALVAQDAERLARFDREAKLLASLNHANIASVFGLHEDGDVRFLVMEFVEGEDLLGRLNRGLIPLDEALGIARQIADALQSAHEQGVVHRDLKPANVQLTPEGKVKVLDFGLAKAFEPDPSSPANPSMSPTLTTQGTVAGVILGTAGYMSPEQARGHPADKRSDVWAFGVVLYEMLCGRRAFEGDTVSDTLASVLKLDPNWEALPSGLPRGVQRLLRRCLQKDPRQRLHDIADARIEIDESTSAAGQSPFVEEPQTATPQRTRWPVTAVLAVAALAAGLAAGRISAPEAPRAPVRRFFIPVDAEQPFNQWSRVEISPDGRRIAYSQQGKLWLRELDSVEPRLLVEQGGWAPFWSPDGSWLGYLHDKKIWRVPVGGGQSVVIGDLPDRTRSVTWSSEQAISVNAGKEILELPVRGGEPVTLHETDPRTEDDFHDLASLPDGRGLLLVVHRNEGVDTLAVWATGTRRTILQIDNAELGSPHYSATGHILFERQNRNRGIWALPFSLASLDVTGAPFLVVPGGAVATTSADGTLVYIDADASSETELAWLRATGEIEGPIGQPQREMFSPALSPDGTRVAVAALENNEWDIWVHDVARGTKTRLTADEARESRPSWSPDGETILFSREVSGSPETIYRMAADGSGELEAIVEGDDSTFSADMSEMVFERDGDDTGSDLWAMSLDGSSQPTMILGTAAREEGPALSPDGRFVAYVSDESGRRQVYLTPYPSGAGRWQVSVDQGWFPSWNHAGDRIYFQDFDTGLMRVSVSTSPRVVLGKPELVVENQEKPVYTPWRGRAMTRDEERFVVVRNVEQENPEDEPTIGFYVVENWFADFR